MNDDATDARPVDPRPLAVVTGAASGIGRGLAISLAGDGWRVAMADRNPAGLADTAEAARRAAGPGNHPVVDSAELDIADFDAVKGWADGVVAKHGAPRDVYNAAGISVWGDPTTLPHAKWRGVIDINLMGTIHIVEAFTPSMADAGRGRLVCVSSAAGILGLPWHGAYSASKAGVLGLCEVLRFDLAPKGISVHAVVPGAVDTPLVRTIDIDGIDRDAPRVTKATKLFRNHAISPAKAAAIIRYEVDAGTYLIPTSPDVPVGRWAQVNMPWAYRGAMKLLNRGLRWAADGAAADRAK
ncbi:SDR family oxidoreductase [Corynebacterium hansenii]|uniref:SDR family oxidoreductase n=1 Tax=Corynebacterium hansenii TaxID=394964 RepID=A0ABV7ZQS0_9CORY|nr:SDR family oxidoreductase [Corynebacterium hansenii]WJZ00048.1 Putative oxidoreductase SadH [Corynebacterium hansenii]